MKPETSREYRVEVITPDGDVTEFRARSQREIATKIAPFPVGTELWIECRELRLGYGLTKDKHGLLR